MSFHVLAPIIPPMQERTLNAIIVLFDNGVQMAAEAKKSMTSKMIIVSGDILDIFV
jgi:hypothetical protein